MLPVTLAPEPASFDERVRQCGVLAIHERIGVTPPRPRNAGRACERATTKDGALIDRAEDLERRHFPPYWTRALDDLVEAYDHICSYSCFAIHEVTGARSVDHMIPLSDDSTRVYEWDNYRLAATALNARKSDFRDVLDPFEVGDDWFRMDFVRFKLWPGPSLADPQRARVADTIGRLGLNRKKLRERRRKDYRRYVEGRIGFDILTQESPLVAREVTRAGKLRPADQPEASSPRG